MLYEVHLKKIRLVHITASSWLFITTVCSECQTKHTDRPTVVGLLDPEDEGTTLLPHVGNYIYRSTWHNFSKDLNVHKLCRENFNPLTPNDPYSGRTAPLTCILYIYSTNLGAEYFKHGIYSPFFPLQNAVRFIILTYLVPVLFTFYIQDVLKLKKK